MAVESNNGLRMLSCSITTTTSSALPSTPLRAASPMAGVPRRGGGDAAPVEGGDDAATGSGANTTKLALQCHRTTVVNFLRDLDISIRQCMLELIYHS
jgi:hypothetical protein